MPIKVFNSGFMLEMTTSQFLTRLLNDELFKFLIVIVDEKLLPKVDDKKFKATVDFVQPSKYLKQLKLHLKNLTTLP